MIDRILGKIPTMFERDWNAPGRPIINQVVAGCEWVLAGEGYATRKWDGTPIAVIQRTPYKRLDNKPGRTMPADWIRAQPEPDPVTGEQPGWVPLDASKKEDQLILATMRIQLATMQADYLPDGTYEFCGPKVNGNPEKLTIHELIPHGIHRIELSTWTFEGFAAYLADAHIEGLVFYHPDGRMAKIKARENQPLSRFPEYPDRSGW